MYFTVSVNLTKDVEILQGPYEVLMVPRAELDPRSLCDRNFKLGNAALLNSDNSNFSCSKCILRYLTCCEERCLLI